MKRDTVSAYRARAKDAEASIDAGLAEEATRKREEWNRALQNAREADRTRVRLTRADVLGMRYVKTRSGWHEVVRCNTKTVTVATEYSWTSTIPFDKVLEVRKSA